MANDIKGLSKLLKKLDKLGVDVEKQIDEVTEANALEIVAKAKSLAPSNIGKLRQGISSEKDEDVGYKISANAPYSGYIEFGTGKKVSVPIELQDVAQALKNAPKGNFETGLASIKAWCRTKGIDEEAAYPIFLSILKQGIEPQPFLYPAYVGQQKQYIKDLEAELKAIVKNLNG